MNRRIISITWQQLLSFIGLCGIVLQVVSAPVQALDLQTSLQYGVPHYDKDFKGDCITTNGISLSGGAVAEKIFNYFVSTPFSTNGGKPMNAIQAAAFVGNLTQESGPGSDPSHPSPDPTITNSIGAFGIGQWLGGRKDALIALATRQGLQPADLEAQLAYMKQELEGGESAIMANADFQAGSDLAAVTKAIRVVYERPGESEANDAKRLQYAQADYDQFKGNAPASAQGPSQAAAGCTSAAAHTGSMITTALGLAWDHPVSEGQYTKADARKEYVDAIAQYGNIHSESDGITPYSDCGRFVSTVIRMSGIDTSYPLVDVSAQRSYVLSNKTKYTTIENPSMSQLRAGDILMSDQHTAIYLGSGGQGGKYDTVDASLGQRVPAVSNNMSSYLVNLTNTLLVHVN